MHSTTPPAAPALTPALSYNPNSVRWLLFALMAFFGLTLSVIGPAIPSLSQGTGVALDTGGLIFTFQGLGFLAAVLTAGAAVDRTGRRPVLLMALLVIALGYVLVPLSGSFPIMLGYWLLIGAGQAGLEVTLNVVAGDLDSAQRAAALNRLHLFFGVGSILGPSAVGASLGLGGIHWVYWATAAASLALLAGLRQPFPPPASGVGSGVAPGAGPSPFRLPAAWMLALVFFFYVGAEVGVGGWLFAILGQSGLTTAAASLLTSAFWLSLSAGRLAASVLLSTMRIERVLLGSIALAAAGIGLVTFGHGSAWVGGAGALLAGLAFGPIFPTTLGWATTRFPHAVGRISSMCIALGGTGGMVLPWIQGKILVSSGVTQAMLLPLGLTAMMAVLVTAAARRQDSL